MKKNKMIVTIVIAIIVSILSIGTANAYTVNRTDAAYLTTATGGQYKLNIYRAGINGQDFMTYCIDAGRTYGGNGSYSQGHLISPVNSQGTPWYTFDVAATKAYQLMQEKGYATTTKDNNVIGELVFRWITEAFASGGCGPQCGYQLSTAHNLFKKLTLGFDTRDWRVQAAVDIYNEASTVALKNLSYKQYIEQGLLWGFIWETKDYKVNGNMPLPPNQALLTIEIDIKDGKNVPSRIDYEAFTVTLENPTVANKIISQKSRRANPGGTKAVIEVVFDSSEWDGNNPMAVIETKFCDEKNSSSQLYMLERDGRYGYQRMLVVLPGNCSNRYDNPAPGYRYRPTYTEGCTCNTENGVYEYKKYKNGSLQKAEYCDPATQDCSSFISEYSCPATCTPAPKVCQIVNKNNTKEYWCSDGQICENGKSQYEAECGSAINCTPNISVPSDCNNFNIDDTLTGIVSDINEVSSSCNPDTNQVTQCVLGKSDLTGQSFEATNEMKDNPYCKVWCKESYEFDLPTAQLSQSGGYFTLSTKISGTRDCYTSSADDPNAPIDYDKFKVDLKEKQNAVIDAWNEYNKWVEAVNKNGNEVHKTDTHGPVGSKDCCDTKYEMIDGKLQATGCNDSGCSGGDTTTDDYYLYAWTYTAYNHDGSTYLGSATHSSGTAGSCPSSCCTSSSCTDGVDGTPQMSYFVAQKAAARTSLINAINAMYNVINVYNSCSEVITNNSTSSFVGGTFTSSEWSNNMKFDPEVDFTYNEDYMSQMNGQFKEVANTKTSGSKEVFCSNDIDGQYKCSNPSSTVATTTVSYLNCDEGSCSWKTSKISNAKWIQKSKSYSAKYQPSNQFSTYTQYGTIKMKWDNCSGNDCLWTNLPENALPVSLLKETGVFPFKFEFKNIGQSNKTTDLGRLMGNASSVIEAYAELPDSEKCLLEGGKATSITEAGYVCHYLNNCTHNCDFVCEDGKCSYETPDKPCEDGKCELICPTCIIDGKTTYSFRPVSLNNLFPNNREIGYNWNATHKAVATKKEIDEMDEAIYETPQYSYTLTPTNLKNIREYNDAASSYTNTTIPQDYQNDAKTNNAIYCEKLTLNGIEYSVKCNSSFLDIIENTGNEFAQNTGDNKWIRPEESERFTLFTDADVQNITNCGPASNYACLSRENGIGPSWK